MRINGIHGVNQVYKNNKANKAYGSSSVAAGKDTLALSDFAKELSVAKAAVSSTPDVRQAKVDDIKSQIKLEELKDELRDQKTGQTSIKKKKEIAYKDEGTGFGGIFASKLDEVVKKDDGK